MYFRQIRRRDAPHVFHAAVTNGNRLFPKRVTAVLDLIDERLGIRLKVRRSLLDGLNIDAIDGLGQESGHAGGCDEANGAQDEKSHRSEEHTSELQSLIRISYAVFCLKKKKTQTT